MHLYETAKKSLGPIYKISLKSLRHWSLWSEIVSQKIYRWSLRRMKFDNRSVFAEVTAEPRAPGCREFSWWRPHAAAKLYIQGGPKSKVRTHGHNSVKSEPIYKMFSQENCLVNLQWSVHQKSHHSLHMLPRYLQNINVRKQAINDKKQWIG